MPIPFPFRNRGRAWRAHRLRPRLAHSSDEFTRPAKCQSGTVSDLRMMPRAPGDAHSRRIRIRPDCGSHWRLVREPIFPVSEGDARREGGERSESRARQTIIVLGGRMPKAKWANKSASRSTSEHQATKAAQHRRRSTAGDSKPSPAIGSKVSTWSQVNWSSVVAIDASIA